MNFAILLGLLMLASMVTAKPWRQHRHRDEKTMQADEAPFEREAFEEKLPNSEEILQLEPQSFDDDDNGIEIDEEMPSGGGDVLLDDDHDDEEDDDDDDKQKDMLKARADYGKALDELMPPSMSDERYAPSNESFEHFQKLKPSNYTMKKRQNAMAIKNGKNPGYWPYGTVPYEFQDEIKGNSHEKGQILAAMKEWEEKTCLKFEPYSDELASQLGHKNRIRLIGDKPAEGCSTYVGWYSYWKVHQVYLARDGCMHAGIVMHELGHMLGFEHEHQRGDRDEYLDFKKDNVKPGFESNINIINKFSMEDMVSSAYDYRSIMHYGKVAFGKPYPYKTVSGKLMKTLIPKYSCYEDIIGISGKHLSFYDHKLMNSIYGCTKECDSSQCGKNCYSTKSGENGNCHCVCLDVRPCMENPKRNRCAYDGYPCDWGYSYGCHKGNCWRQCNGRGDLGLFGIVKEWCRTDGKCEKNEDCVMAAVAKCKGNCNAFGR